MTPARLDVLRRVAARIPARPRARVAIDGPDAAGKTTFADQLAAVIDRPVVRVSLDDFHHPRAVRYQRGRESPEGFWLHAFDHARFRADVLDPLSPRGSGRYRPAAHDLMTDRPLNPEPRTAPPGAVLVADGLFLLRDELADAWDLTVFLDVPFTETARRMAARDGTSPDPEHPGVRRYVEAQRVYFRRCAPHQRADIVVDNSDPGAPVIPR